MIEARKFLGKRIESVMEVVEHEPPRRFAIRAASSPVPFLVTSRLAEENHGTRVDAILEGDPGKLFRLGQSLVVRAAEHELRKNLAALKRVLEERS